MDDLRRDDIERARMLGDLEKSRAMFAAVADGIRLKRAALRARHPQASEVDVDAMLKLWLLEDRDA